MSNFVEGRTGGALPDAEAQLLAELLAGQVRAAERVAAAGAPLVEAARRVAAGLRAGGRLVYLGAGTSGALGVLDGAELPGTFGLAAERIAFVTPGGGGFAIDGPGEDDAAAAAAALDALALGPADVVVALAASGATPFTLAGARRARQRGAAVVAVLCRAGAPLAAMADVAVELDIGPEAVDGSTRLAAGTAQKAALGVISTLACALLGHVYEGRMVNLRADNAKLRARARAIVATVARVDEAAAAQALERTNGDVKAAAAAAAGGLDGPEALALVEACGGDLGAALGRLRG